MSSLNEVSILVAMTISIITLLILLCMFIIQECLSMAAMLAEFLFNT